VIRRSFAAFQKSSHPSRIFFLSQRDRINRVKGGGAIVLEHFMMACTFPHRP
jgi:hypothetical protein